MDTPSALVYSCSSVDLWKLCHICTVPITYVKLIECQICFSSAVITSGLPNIVNYLKVVLKKEKLSEEAEAKRQKYEILLSSLEQGHHAGGRPLSIICDDDSGYFSSNRIRG